MSTLKERHYSPDACCCKNCKYCVPLSVYDPYSHIDYEESDVALFCNFNQEHTIDEIQEAADRVVNYIGNKEDLELLSIDTTLTGPDSIPESDNYVESTGVCTEFKFAWKKE